MKTEPKKPCYIDIGDLNVGKIYHWDYADKDQDLHFRINSMGGDLQTSVYLMKRMMKEKRKVITENFGQCQSGGFIAFIGGQERLSSKENTFMFHSGNTNGNFTIDSLQNFLNKCEMTYLQQIMRLTKISNRPSKYWSDILKSDKNVFFTGKELYKLGIVTKIV